MTASRDRRWKAGIVPGLLILTMCCVTFASEDDEVTSEAAVIRILTAPGSELRGRTQIETLAIDPRIRRVVFFVDGAEASTRGRPPWNAKVALDDPPREQTIEARAYGAGDHVLGSDSVVVNRRPIPFRVSITSLAEGSDSSTLEVEAAVSIPRGATLDRVDFYFNEELGASVDQPPYAARVRGSASGSGDFVRAVVTLKDGRCLEDVRVIGAPGLTEEVDVNLVQVQVLVTHKNGAPLTDLGRGDFEVLQGGKPREIESFYLAPDVALVLGLVLDSSGSMQPLWRQATQTAKQFLNQTLEERDRAFLVNFDEKLELAHPLTNDLGALFTSLDELVPEGGTALYDSILYALLQFEDEPGRRALVILTDGFDSSSTTNERHVVDFGHKLGAPVYVIALESGAPPTPGAAMASRSAIVHTLKLVTEPTGGRLLRVGSAGGLGRAFAQIDAELRHQYVLTYYTDVLPDEKRQKITIRVKGRKDVEVRAVFAWDQVS